MFTTEHFRRKHDNDESRRKVDAIRRRLPAGITLVIDGKGSCFGVCFSDNRETRFLGFSLDDAFDYFVSGRIAPPLARLLIE